MVFKSIVVATDGSKFSEEALKYAANLARETKAKLTVVHVVNVQGYIEVMWHDMKKKYVEDAERIMAELKERCNNAVDLSDIEVDFVVKEGIPYKRIVETAKEKEADVIILGSHGHSALEKILLGSVAERVIGISPVPVMVVPPKTG